MTDTTGSVIEEEKRKIEKEIEEASKELEELEGELEAERERKEIEEKELCKRGSKTRKEEDLEWDVYMTKGKLKYKRKELKEYLKSDILNTRINQVKEELKWCKEVLKESEEELTKLRTLAEEEEGKNLEGIEESKTAKFQLIRCESGKAATENRIFKLKTNLDRLEREKVGKNKRVCDPVQTKSKQVKRSTK